MKRLLLVLALVLLAGQALAVDTFTWRGDGGTNLWATPGCWDSAGVTAKTTIPASSTPVVFDASSTRDCNVATGVSAVTAALSMTAYTNTITIAGTGGITAFSSVSFPTTGHVITSAATGFVSFATTTTQNVTSNSTALHPLECRIFFGTSGRGASTMVLKDDFYTNMPIVFIGSASAVRTINSSTGDIYAGGDVIDSVIATGGVTGSAVLHIVGTGAQNVRSALNATGRWGLSIIENHSGTTTFTGRFGFGDDTATPTWTHTSGTSDWTNGRLAIVGTQPKILSGAEGWSDITNRGAGTISLGTALNATGICSLAVATIFAGGYGFTVGTLWSDAGLTQTFGKGNNYIVQTYLWLPGTIASPITVASSSATDSTYLSLQTGGDAAQDVAYTIATRVSARQGKAIYDPNGTLTTATRWYTTSIVPTVTLVSPLDLSTAIKSNANVLATFSFPMNALLFTSTTAKILNGSTPVAAAISYVDTTLTLDPTANLAANTTYTVTLTTGCVSADGWPMASNYSWTFTTGILSSNNLVTARLPFMRKAYGR